MRVGIVGLFAVAFAVGCTAEQSSGWPDAVRERAAADHRWDADAIEVGGLGDLDHGGCRFFRAGNPRVLDSWTYTYVVLPSDELGGTPSPATAAQVLRECGDDADATWQAHVLTEFSGAVPGIVVDAESVGSAERLIREAGAEYFPPRADEDTVTFYVRNFDVGSIHLVEATLPSAGEVVVTTRPIVAAR